jgi:hypothetical protein
MPKTPYQCGRRTNAAKQFDLETCCPDRVLQPPGVCHDPDGGVVDKHKPMSRNSQLAMTRLGIMSGSWVLGPGSWVLGPGSWALRDAWDVVLNDICLGNGNILSGILPHVKISVATFPFFYLTVHFSNGSEGNFTHVKA